MINGGGEIWIWPWSIIIVVGEGLLGPKSIGQNQRGAST